MIRRNRSRFIVPNEIMIPIGAEATQSLKKCADNWSDDDIKLLRVRLPPEFHSVPEFALRQQWINLRKKSTEGFVLNGHGPRKGSRKRNLHRTPDWYAEYINGEDWKRRKQYWHDLWENRCATCNVSDSDAIMEVHHRTYERRGNERPADCILLCASCHRLFHDHSGVVQPRQKGLFE